MDIDIFLQDDLEAGNLADIHLRIIEAKYILEKLDYKQMDFFTFIGIKYNLFTNWEKRAKRSGYVPYRYIVVLADFVGEENFWNILKEYRKEIKKNINKI